MWLSLSETVLLGPDTTFIRREVSLLIAPDTTFIRKGSVFANRARHYI